MATGTLFCSNRSALSNELLNTQYFLFIPKWMPAIRGGSRIVPTVQKQTTQFSTPKAVAAAPAYYRCDRLRGRLVYP